MTKNEDLPEIEELEKEIFEFIEGMTKSKDKQEFEMYRQMIKININLLKVLLKR